METGYKTPEPVFLQILNSESGSGFVPIFAMLLHTFYIHHTIHIESVRLFSKNSTPDPLRSGLEPYPSLESTSTTPYFDLRPEMGTEPDGANRIRVRIHFAYGQDTDSDTNLVLNFWEN